MRIGTINAGQALRFVFAEPALVHWGIDDWQHPQDTVTVRGMLGLQVADLASEALAAGQRICLFDPGRGNRDLGRARPCDRGRFGEDKVQGMLVSAATGQIDRDAAD